MKTVYKYPLGVADYQLIVLPVGAKILCVKMQRGVACLWALVDKEQTQKESVTIRIAGTGHDIEEDVEYIDTIMVAGGEMVFHFFKALPTART